jgi:UDP-N-acetylglucosamine diphosphorylase / glucose-1-phosphate thymidylyltransferase / UDP-N-acetylgalactosamine diphosphorylase / glucosamine-1-phosphate N-acetyltransferase / galactosamine-1-phosphate N-acetyltransferase
MKTSFIKNNSGFKALILAGGRGKRLGIATQEENKCLFKFDGKYLIEYSLENALKLDVDEIVIVVGHMAERIINKFGISFQRKPIKYVIQWECLGLVHAMECSRSMIGDSDFILLLGDEFLLDVDYRAMMSLFFEKDAFAVCGVIPVTDLSVISKTYSILFDTTSQRIFRLVEKPKNPFNNLMGTGNILFKKEIFDYIPLTPIHHHRQEKELPDLIQCSIDDGGKVYYCSFASTYVNVNTPEDITIIQEMAR